MLLDRGTAEVRRESQLTPSGNMPQANKAKIFESYYGERTVGFNRYFTAMANDSRADLLIRIQRFDVSIADEISLISVLGNGEPQIFKVVQVQHLTDEDGPLMTDLTLERTEGVNDPE